MHESTAIHYLHFPFGLFAPTAREEWDRLKKNLQASKAPTNLLVTQEDISDYNHSWLDHLEQSPRANLAVNLLKFLQDLDELAPQLAKCIFVARHHAIGSINCLASYCGLRLMTRTDRSVGCDEFRHEFFLPLQFQFLGKPLVHGVEFGYTPRFFAGEHHHGQQWQFDPIPSPEEQGDEQALLERVQSLKQSLPSNRNASASAPTTQELPESIETWQHLALLQIQKHKSPYLAYLHLGRKRHAERKMELAFLATWFAHQGKGRSYQSFLRRQIWSQAWSPAMKSTGLPLVQARKQNTSTSSSPLEVTCHPEYLPPHAIMHLIRNVGSLLIRTEELDHALHYGNVMQSELEKNYKPAWAKQLWQHNLALSVGHSSVGSMDRLSLDLENWLTYEPAGDKEQIRKCRLMGYSPIGVPILETTADIRLSEQMPWAHFFHTGQSPLVEATGYCTTDVVRYVVINEFLRLYRDFKISFGPLIAALTTSEAQANQVRQQWQKFAHNTYRQLREDPLVAKYLQASAPPNSTNYQNILIYMDSSSMQIKEEWSATLIKRHLSMLIHMLARKILANEQDAGILFWASGLNLDWVHWTADWSQSQQQDYVSIMWPHSVTEA